MRRPLSACVVLALAAALLPLIACDEIAKEFGYIPAPKSDPPKQVQTPRVIHHFEPVAKSEGSLAVDTATGRMCKTWEWVCTKGTYKNPWTGKWEEASTYGISCSAIELMPTCEQLSKKD